MRITLLLITALLSQIYLFGQSVRWVDAAPVAGSEPQITASKYRTITVDFETLKSQLSQAPDRSETAIENSETYFPIPFPSGENIDFQLVEASIMHPDLQARYPEIRSYMGRGTGAYSHATVRLDYTLKGFHAQVFMPGKTFYIDPYADGDLNTYIVYTRKDFFAATQKSMSACEPRENSATGSLNNSLGVQGATNAQEPVFHNLGSPDARASNGSDLRTYALALACTGEYAQFHGGTVPMVMSAFTTSMNRVNGVFMRDLSIEMIFIADNDDLIYLNAATDPYSNGNGGAMLSQNQTTIDDEIGFSGYDIGHVFSTGGGGVAYLNSPCGALKAGGVTGQSSPVGDPFDIDYVAHEMGHQYGGNHTQNNTCNRSGQAAYEPGSASTIMGYAGICSPNIQSNSDDYFHNHSYNEMRNFTVSGNGNTCATTTSSGNTPPDVTVDDGGFVIPISTPFELTATATDLDNDPLLYCWEQYNLGPATSGGDFDLSDPSGNAPTFRSFDPVAAPTRVFPRLENLVNNTTLFSERLPTYSRDLIFRCTVRDYAPEGGGVDDAEIAFSASDLADFSGYCSKHFCKLDWKWLAKCNMGCIQYGCRSG